jgi:peptidoglycan-associated lipoprotein
MICRNSTGTIIGCLALAAITSACGVSRSDHDADIAALRSSFAADSARRDTMVVRALSAAILLNAEQEDRLANLESGMAAMGARMDEIEELAASAIRFNAPVHFAFDSYEITDGAMPVLDRFAAVVQRFYGDALITVEGFADPAGDVEYNTWLGQQRADAVMQYLVEAGVDAGQLRAVSYGDARNRQVEPGAYGDNGIANRRVAFVVDYKEGM